MTNVKKTKVIANSTKHFFSQEEAREYAIKILEAGLTYLTIENDTDC